VKQVSELIFRQITPADFFHINRKPQSGDEGGKQGYIDFPVGKVSLADWEQFFEGIDPDESSKWPVWHVELHSLGNLGSQNVDIGQRRLQSVNIRSQKIFSDSGNRVFAWHPDYGGFPTLSDAAESSKDPSVIATSKGIRVFLLKTIEGEHWAGWLRTEQIEEASEKDVRLKPMLAEPAGKIVFGIPLALDTSSLENPFRLNSFGKTDADEDSASPEKSVKKSYGKKPSKSEEELAEDLFKDDTPPEAAKKTQKIIETFERNRKAVRDLKRLYKTCQITGDDFVFSKVNGEPYLEVHHLVPLGEGGFDNSTNLVVISAHIHRMLHYAIVEGLDLAKIVDDKLNFTINGKSFTITWRPEHAKVIADAGGTTV